jgi:hypothetical protein
MNRQLAALVLSLPIVLSGLAAAAQTAPQAPIQSAEPQAAPEEAVQPPVLATFKEAALPPDLGVQTGNYIVTLVLTVDENGAVTEVQETASDEPRLSPLAASAARSFIFTPAQYQGKPVAVQITYRYAFDIRPKERRIVYTFNMFEKGTRAALDGVTAVIEQNGRSFTALSGHLEVSDLPPGNYTLYVPTGEFVEVRRNFTVRENAVGNEDLRLDRRYGSTNQTIIRAPKEARFVARQTLEATELRRLPGSAGDPLKMVENLPGVARSAFGTGQLVVFGSSPFDTQVLVDGLPFVNLYHFGGLYSTINPEFIQRIDFTPAGFDASFGQASAGIVDVKIKSEPLTALHGQIDVNLLHAGLYFGLPTNDDGDFQFAFRRSYIDAILGAIPMSGNTSITTAPRYYDYQGRLRQRFGKHQLTLFVFGTDDSIVLLNKKVTSQEAKFIGNVSLSSATHNVQLRWTYDHSSTFKNSFSVQTALTDFKFDLFNAVKFNIRSSQTNLREEIDWRVHEKVWLHLGTTGLVQPSWFDVKSPEPQRQGAIGTPLASQETLLVRGSQYLFALGPYMSVEWKPFSWWTIVPSVRADVYFGDWKSWSIDPRLSSRWEVLKDRLSIKAAGGLYQQPPAPFAYIQGAGNTNLKPQAAAHALLGLEATPIDRLTISAEAFYKYLFNQAEVSDDRTVRYTSKGKGRAYGFDALVRLNPGGRLIGWIAYTFTRSEIWDFRTKAWRRSDYDQTHLLNILVSYELPKHWTIGGRFRLTSGFPYTPIASSVYDSDLDRHIGVASTRINSKRLPLFHQLDLRVDKEWVFDDWKFGMYLEIQNVYYAKNAEGLVYNYDLTKTSYITGIPFLPVLGFKGTW